MLNLGATEPAPGFLGSVRELCTRYDIALIFDEVITGFRLAIGGAVERYGVVPDLATFGKAMAGGWPVAAFAGSARYMDLLADGGVNHSGTFNGSTMACAAVAATIDVLRREPPYASIERYGKRIMSALPDLANDHGLSLEVTGLPMAFSVSLRDPAQPPTALRSRKELSSQLHRALAEAGIWTTTRGMWFVSAAHGEEEVAKTLSRAGDAFGLVQADGVAE